MHWYCSIPIGFQKHESALFLSSWMYSVKSVNQHVKQTRKTSGISGKSETLGHGMVVAYFDLYKLPPVVVRLTRGMIS